MKNILGDLPLMVLTVGDFFCENLSGKRNLTYVSKGDIIGANVYIFVL